MTYYAISTDWNPKIIGVNNGIYQCELIENQFSSKDNYNKIIDLSRTGAISKLDEDYNFEYFKLRKKAKVTDIISFTPYIRNCHFIVNSKAKGLLSDLNLPNCHYLQANLFSHKKERIKDSFYVLYSTFHDFNKIDFTQSSFYRLTGLDEKEYLVLNNLESYKEKLQKHPLITCETVALKKEYIDSDFLSTGFGVFVSERLLDRWMSFGLTGFREKKINIIVV